MAYYDFNTRTHKVTKAVPHVPRPFNPDVRPAITDEHGEAIETDMSLAQVIDQLKTLYPTAH